MVVICCVVLCALTRCDDVADVGLVAHVLGDGGLGVVVLHVGDGAKGALHVHVQLACAEHAEELAHKGARHAHEAEEQVVDAHVLAGEEAEHNGRHLAE